MSTRVAGWVAICLLASGGCFLKGASNQVPQRGQNRCTPPPPAEAPEDFLGIGQRDDGYCRFAQLPGDGAPTVEVSETAVYRTME